MVLTEKSLLCESRRIQLNAVTDGSCLSFFEASDLYAFLPICWTTPLKVQ